ncbi:hypothetical protein BJ170DRAFT_631681 [Xylariales sp. AK1849]|nr:hypothetical protein BJ170DRAFT_631681 [Xylariales sp. AK1849]
MEGNLSRARSSLSSADSDSTPSPTFPRPMTAVHREHDSGLVKSQRGHNRISSENNIANDPKPTVLHSPRASSALGAAGGYRQPLQSSQGVDHTRESPKNGSPRGNPMYGNAGLAKSKSSLLQEGKHTLEPLSEDDVPDTMGSARPSLEDARLDSFLSPTFGSFPEQGLRRSASVSQMRDLKDQMNDLKGRLSTLRDQARADSMKRRSMQSLRTPSPFTHAREWYTEKNDDHIDTPIMSDVSRWSSDSASLHEVNVMSNEDRALAEPRDDSSLISTSVYSDHETSPQTKLSPADSHHSPGETTPNVTPSAEEDENGDSDDMKTEDGYQDDTTELEDDTSESGESSYEDSVQNQVSHEDREDAFDYEHFFLHSAMGSMSQKRLRRKDSQNSFSSEESVETTRGPTATNSAGEGTRGRRGSNASTSTMESFATATEGRTTRVDNNSTGYFPEQIIEAPERSRSHTPDTAKKTAFGLGSLSSDSNMDRSQPRASVIRRPQSSAATFMHRPSVSSMGSTGTNRSFPLVNRPKTNGILTPGVSPDQELKQISETLMSETASICDRESVHSGDQTIEMLQKEDQILVERLVASLGRCVLGLTESGRASTESRLFRRRIETARQILEGLEQPT